MITLITGGVKSGKSAYALELLNSSSKGYFIATADPGDESMSERIKNHQDERKEYNLETIEAQIDISTPLRINEGSLFVIDCLTMWVANMMYMATPDEMELQINHLIDELSRKKSRVIIITNEVGLGIIPENKLSRDYAAHLAGLNKKLAKIADRVIFMISGIPLDVKSK